MSDARSDAPEKRFREMTDFTNMTKKQLLALETVQLIKGRHEMTKDELVARLTAATQPVETQPVVSKITPHVVPAPTLDDDKLAEIGVQIIDQAQKKVKAWVNKSGNIPWRKKHYMVDETVFADRVATGEVGKAPNQVQLILRGMIEMGFTTADRSRIGKDIIDALKQAGKLNTTIPSASLFAYYRKVMEGLGVVHVTGSMIAAAKGYDPTVGGADVDGNSDDGDEEGEE